MMAFCKHLVMDKCEKSNRTCTFRKDCFEPEEIKPMTNGDRLRAMSDEELAKFLCSMRSSQSYGFPCSSCVAEEFCHDGHTGMIDWLQHPEEEVADDGKEESDSGGV